MNNTYKNTLNLGSTTFEMRGNLKNKEPLLEKKWTDEEIYRLRLQKNQNKPLFILHDGPPYANGDLHIGHALNKTLKDFVVRWKNASGYQAPYVMGWDTHGLPIEIAVTKTGVDRKKLAPKSFRHLTRTYALNQVKNQAKQFRRLGIFSDYDLRYLTLDPEYELNELKLFAKMFDKGLIYRDLKPIYWSPSSETALAESEIIYQNVKSPSVYVAFNLVQPKRFSRPTSLIIWTTTPWTLAANQLVAVAPELEYIVVRPEHSTQDFIVAKNRLQTVAPLLGWDKYHIVETIKGQDLINLKYNHPLYPNQTSHVVGGDHVTDAEGTGIVHIAGGFGEDDYLLVKKHGLKPFAPIDNQGKFTKEVKDKLLEGQFYLDANRLIGERLEKTGQLLKLKFITHSYPHDWRTKEPVIYRVTPQWFINLKTMKKPILKQVNTVDTFPHWAKHRLHQVLDSRNDWTISRQRLWGVPIIGFYDQNHQLVLNSEILDFAIKKIETLGTDAWFSEPANTFLPKQYHHQNLTKETDTLDVWFDSGSSSLALEKRFPNWKRPYDLYLEGNDQYRGWFNSSMINSVIYDQKSPYKTLISHGMTTDQKGRKMSKSLGNGLDPIEFANTMGADILRLWVASTDYQADQKIGKEIINQVSESYRKIRNTLRFILANLYDFQPDKNYQKTLQEVDYYALHQLTKFKNKATEAFENYDFSAVYNAVLNYVIKDLSAFYLDFIKDILYVDLANSSRRRQVQTVLYEQLWALIDILRPILPYTMEELYQNFPWKTREKSIHLLDNRSQNFKLKPDQSDKWKAIMAFKAEVNQALEQAKIKQNITKTANAQVLFELKPEFKGLVKQLPQDLAQIFIVAHIREGRHDKDYLEQRMSWIKVEPALGDRCERCWTVHHKLVDNQLCERCARILKEKGGQ